MIRLHTLLQEISLETTAPYVTQFVRTPVTYSAVGYESEAQAADIRIAFEMSPLWRYTVTHAKSVVHVPLSYLRILRTALEALLDFLAQHAQTRV